MAKYENNYITAEQFEALLQLGLTYDGFVIGQGYMYTCVFKLDPRHMQINTSRYNYSPFEDQYVLVTAQYWVNSEEAIALSYEGDHVDLIAYGEDNEIKNDLSDNVAISKFKSEESWLHKALYWEGSHYDGANTGYQNWAWDSPDVQVPLQVISTLLTFGASIESEGFIKMISYLSIGNNVINLAGLDSKIPGYNNPYFKAARDATFVAADTKNIIGVFESPTFIIDGTNSAKSFYELFNEITNE